MFSRIALTVASLLTVLTAVPSPSGAGDLPPVKIGIVYSYTGASPTAGVALDASISAWLAMHNQLVAGRKVVIIRRDDTGAAPDIATRQAQDLVLNEHVDFLVGGLFTPSAIAVERVSTAAKVPFFIVNAATNGILANAPYTFRFSATIQQNTAPLAQWAAKQGYKSVFSLVSDYAPGIESDKVFSTNYTSGGGKVLGDLHVPVTANEFTAYVQRIKDAHPEVNFTFVVSGTPAIAYFKAAKQAQFDAAGIKVLTNAATVDDLDLAAMGDVTLGVISCAQYSWTHKSRLNDAYLAAYHRVAPADVANPDFMAESGYDIMSAIDRVVSAQHGALDLDKTLGILKGLKLDSPRGPIQVDPKTRELIENVYIRRIEKVNGLLASVEFATIPNVPGDYP